MLDGARSSKLILLVGGLLWLGGWAAYAARGGLAAPWLAAALGMLLAYGAFGWLSYRGPRARWIAGGAAAVLTLAVAWVSFTHLGLVLGGLAVTTGCVLPARAQRPSA